MNAANIEAQLAETNRQRAHRGRGPITMERFLETAREIEALVNDDGNPLNIEREVRRD